MKTKIIFSLLFLSVCLYLLSLYLHNDLSSYSVLPKKYTEDSKIKILDAKVLNFSKVHELSALAYRHDTLFALSDQGVLYRFKLKISHNKITKLFLKSRYPLMNNKGKKIEKRDSEGLCFYKNGFLISFERKSRVSYFSLKGKKIRKMELNEALRDQDAYVHPNKGLESVTYSKKYGIVTAPELPLKKHNQKYHTLYAHSKIWKFQADGAITDLTFMNKTKIIVLLRQFSYLTRRKITSLVEVNLQNCNEQRVCQSQLLIRMDSDNGWKIDNFEGLTKVGKDRYLMVSDDNDSIFQKTLLVLFEIKS